MENYNPEYIRTEAKGMHLTKSKMPTNKSIFDSSTATEMAKKPCINFKCINISLEIYDLNQSARQEMQKSSIKLLPYGGFVKSHGSWLNRAFMFAQPALQPFVKLLLQKQERHIYFPGTTNRRVSFTNNNTIIFIFIFIYIYIYFF